MLTTVATFAYPWQAHLLRLRLEADGIPAFVAHEHQPYATALGGIEVQVPEEFLDDAEAIIALGETDGEQPAADPEAQR
jgi:hypothetical protein